MSAEPASDLTTTDGRRARRDQNRERVVDALLELYREGELQPAVAEVAARSGVSHRSVFRYFEDLDELYHIAIARQHEAIAELFQLEGLGEGSLASRIERIVEQRLALYDAGGTVARVGHMRAPVQPVLLQHIRRISRDAREQVGRHFAPELGALDDETRRVVVEAATTALSIETMEALRFIRELDRPAAAEVMAEMLTGLFARR